MLKIVFFFFKQKTAYEILSGLVGSEMCIRDSCGTDSPWSITNSNRFSSGWNRSLLYANHKCIRDSATNQCRRQDVTKRAYAYASACLLYTSDAADDSPCVDLGGRRIIKKKKNT
ncbi:hypothetical protein AMBR_EADFOONE_02828 [Lacticaseibacillus rhamnosus]|nr:hypothetical protein AMBR_EADFOONE_02828 [Lacticaseibacillus rhamnosus]